MPTPGINFFFKRVLPPPPPGFCATQNRNAFTRGEALSRENGVLLFSVILQMMFLLNE
jgi:hypothetical protein